jgi:peptidylprolyl isomerase
MAKGDVSDPIRSDQGFHIVRLMDTQAAAPRPLAEVKPVIATSLRQSKEQDQQQQYIVRLLQKSPVTMHEPELRAALKTAQ